MPPAAAANPNSAPRRESMFRALRYRNFQLFISGQLISLIGTWMQIVAQSWLVYRMTHSAALLGEVGFASQIPVLFLGPVAGMLADRYSRRQIVISTQVAMMFQALAMAVLTLTHTIQVWQIFVLALLLGICNAFDVPARQSFFVEMVGNEDLMNAIAINSSMFNVARSVGPAIAGILVAALGEGLCFLLNGLSFIAVISGLLLIKVHRHASQAGHAPVIEQFKEGLRYVRNYRAMRTLLLLLGIVSLLGMSYTVLMPIFADQVLQSGPRGLGELLTSAGLGALIGALWLARRQRVQGLDRVVAWTCAGFGVSLILFALSRAFWLSMLLLVPAGFCIMTQLASTNTLIQSMVTNNMRGRVMGIYSMMFMGMAPFGSLIAGYMAHQAGAPAAVIFSGCASIIGAAVFSLRRHALKIDDQLRKF
jgi:MFS family permease